MKTKIGVVIDRSATSGGGRPSLGSFLDAAAFNKRHAVVVAICGFTFMFETLDWSALPLVGLGLRSRPDLAQELTLPSETVLSSAARTRCPSPKSCDPRRYIHYR